LPIERTAEWAPALRWTAGALFSLAFLWLASRGVDWASAWRGIRGADPAMLLLALATVVATAWLRAARWRLMFYPEHRRLSLSACFAILLAGQLINAVIPARVGEVARAYMIGRRERVSKMHALWTTALEKALDALTLLLFLAAISFLVPLPAWLQSAGRTLALGLAAVGLLLALIVVMQARVMGWLTRWEARRPWIGRLRLRHALRTVADSLRRMRLPALSLGLARWSVLAFLMGALTNWLTARALGIPLGYGGSLLLLAVLQISAVVPIPTSPGRIGLFHYLCILSLAIFSIGRDAALSYGLVLHVLFYLPMTVGGPIVLWLETRGQSELLALLRGRSASGGDVAPPG